MSPIKSVETFVVPTPFRHSFVLGSGAVGGQGQTGEAVFVKITTADGTAGWGEQRALPSWSYETWETIALVIDRHLAHVLIGRSPFDVAAFHAVADARLSPSVSQGFPFARAAVDIAMHDAAGKIAGVPVHDLLGGRLHDQIELCSAIGVGTPEEVTARVQESGAYRAFKVKLRGDVAADAATIRAASEASTGQPLWLDANQSYRPTGLRQLLAGVADVPHVFCIEQPVASTDMAGMHRCREIVDLPVAIDEGAFTAADFQLAARTGAADLAVVKVCKAGGLRGAQRAITVAHTAGLDVLASGLTDGGVAFAAALHVFAGAPLALPAELNGPELLAELFVDGLTIADGIATVPTAPGLGVTVDEERIRATAIASTRRTATESS